MLVSLVALFVALGGSGYAAMRINGNDIRNRSISAIELKRETDEERRAQHRRRRSVLTGRPSGHRGLRISPRAVVRTAEGGDPAC
jgi:hypothetical protein